jgi:hypothetical protein
VLKAILVELDLQAEQGLQVELDLKAVKDKKVK